LRELQPPYDGFVTEATASVRPPDAARQRILIFLALAVVVPGLLVRFSGANLPHWIAAVLFGFAIVGAAFMLAWAAEVVQLDISAGLALALLALVAVLPEYAVDFVFTWKAGASPSEAAHGLALANMTGSNQLLIGVGWSAVVLLAAWRVKKLGPDGVKAVAPHHDGRPEVALDRSHSVELAFLAVATIYGLTLPLRHSLSIIDAVVLVSLFGGYVMRIARAPAETPHLVGPALLIGSLTVRRRRQVVVLLFVVAAAIILACAEPFAESLVETGKEFNISEFLLVQWLAPLASEAPEFIVALLFAWRLNTNSALGSLVSSKVNQWTLLVGTLPIVYAISLGHLHGLPIVGRQREELWVTAAQSAFALAVLANRRLNTREGFMLLGLFVSQFALNGILPSHLHAPGRIGVGVVYITLAVFTVVRDRRAVPGLLRDGFLVPYSEFAKDDQAIA
jgi:cation:H+ antiporter